MLNWKRIRVHALTLVAGCLLAWSAAQAQRPPEQPPKASNAPTDDGYSVPEGPKLQDKTGQRQPIATLKVNVQVVTVFFNVKDKRGGLIPNLKKEDFQVAEDGKPQTIKYFAAESNQPLTLGLLIDTSGAAAAAQSASQGPGKAPSQSRAPRERCSTMPSTSPPMRSCASRAGARRWSCLPMEQITAAMKLCPMP